MPHARLLLSGANWVVCIYGVVCFHLYVDGFTMASYRKLLGAQAMKRRRPSVVKISARCNVWSRWTALRCPGVHLRKRWLLRERSSTLQSLRWRSPNDRCARESHWSRKTPNATSGAKALRSVRVQVQAQRFPSSLTRA